ncbi:MAG: patatin-like phospholipase family protein [Fusobacterium gastrosuis]|uniref:patatin-like phospholipase family protein n=1 Tax=Fusobacterium gastrosuis TaxID=1755100 RepID=UPI002A9A47FC|nr:patatin-like phospholipase family protein [Fusobacteriaceae bacterium]MDY5795786.1 patatin-like phospholipase family protein [Fusobacterium gastrosuis]
MYFLTVKQKNIVAEQLNKINKIVYISILMFLIIFYPTYSQNTQALKTYEDMEIEKMENEIRTLEKKIKELKLKKEDKNIENLKIGLALSGGGAKGYAHLGVLKLLEREKIKIDYISGTSIGALVGTLYSIGYSIKEIEEVLDELNLENFWQSGSNLSDLSIEKKESLKKYSFYVKYDENFNYSLPKGLKDTETMYLELKKILKGHKDIEDTNKLPIPVRIIATNLNTGSSETIEKGDLARILTASMAIPAILEPVEINGKPYVDGLVSRNLPVQDAYDMGADVVIASDIGTEVTYKNNYNILSILNQMIAIQSSYINKESREKASILILPDLKNISALDTEKKSELIELGEKAAEEKIEELKNLPKKFDASDREIKENKKYFINKIEYSSDFSESMKETLNIIFKDLLGKEVTDKNIERRITRIYNLKYVNKLYYVVKDDVLYLDGEVGHLNTVGVGLNYRSGYGTTINLGTDMYFNGRFGNIINSNLKFGDYLGLDLGTYSYYGRNNKVGLFTRFGYNESPFFLYDKNKKKAKFISKELFLNLGIFSQPNNKTMLSYGISSKIVDFDMDTGSKDSKELEYSGNLNKTYFRFKYDTLDSISVPMKGLKADFIYNFSNSFGGLKTSVYGPAYTVKGYQPITKNLSFLYGLNSAVIRGDNIKADQYLKLGGTHNNIENNEFEFYGYNFQEKSVKEFLSMSIGLRYKLFYSTYLTTKFNVLTYGKEKDFNGENPRMLRKYSKGLGVSLTYDSPIGPVEFTVSDNLKMRKPITTLSIGYKID